MVVGEENVTRIELLRSDEEHAFSPLRQSEAEGVHDAVCPAVPETLELSEQDEHPLALVQMEHERDVLEDDRWYPLSLEQAEDVSDQRRLRSTDALLVSR